uniref:PDZ domain-containing protein n=1 Tax=Eptatretus burgeri TaxID=7764 RepID=A0A8C4N2H2_EPTBU
MGTQSSVPHRQILQACSKVPEKKDACHDASPGDACPVDINPSSKCKNDLLLRGGSMGRLVVLKRELGESFGVDVEIKRWIPARIFILKTQPGGAAERVKLFPGDEIVAVNGIAVTTFDYREACSYFQGLKQDTEIQLSISNTGYSSSLLPDLTQCPSSSSSDFLDHQLKLSSDLIFISSSNPLFITPVTPVWQESSLPHSAIVSQPFMPAELLGSRGEEMVMSDDLMSVNSDIMKQSKNRVKEEQPVVEERMTECEMAKFSGPGLMVIIDGERQTERENDDMTYLENIQHQDDNKVELEDDKGNQKEGWKKESTKHQENMNNKNWSENEEECTRASKCKNWKIGEKGKRKDVEMPIREDTAMEEPQKDAHDNKINITCRKISSDFDTSSADWEMLTRNPKNLSLSRRTSSSSPSLPSSAAPSLPPSPPPLSDDSNVADDQISASPVDQWFISPLVFGSLQMSPQLPSQISAKQTKVQDSEFSENIAKEIVKDKVKPVMMDESGLHNNFKVIEGCTSDSTTNIACEERHVEVEKVRCWSKCVKEDVGHAEYHSPLLAFGDGEPLAMPAITRNANNATKQQTDLLPAESGAPLAEVKNRKTKADYDDSNLVSVQALIQSFEALPRYNDRDQSRKTFRNRQGASWPSWRPQSLKESLSTSMNSFEMKSQLHLWPNSTMDDGSWVDAGNTDKFLNKPNESLQFSNPPMFNQVEALRESRFPSLESDPTDIHVVAKDNEVLKEPEEVQVKGDQNNEYITPSVGLDKFPGKPWPASEGHEIEMKDSKGKGCRWSAGFEVEAETELVGGGESKVVVEESWSVSLEVLSSYAVGKGPRARLTSLLPESDLTSLLEQLQAHEAFWESYFVVLRKEEGMDIGFSITGGSDMELPYVTVHQVFPGGVAANEGSIHHGQRLLWLNGQWLLAVSQSTALRSLHKARTSPHALLVLAKDHEQKVIQSASEIWSKCACTGPFVTVSLPAGTSGLGFSINGGRDSVLGDMPLRIHRLFKGGVAEQSGCLAAGDELLTLGNRDLQDLTRFQAWRLLRAVRQGPVSLVIRKPPAF